MLLSVFLGALTSVTGILRMVSGWNDISFDVRLCGLRKDITGVWEYKLSYPVWRKLVKKGTNILPLEPLAENQTAKRETSRGEVTLDAWDPGKFWGAAADRERKPVLFGTFCISKKHSTLSEKWYDFPPRLKNATPYAKRQDRESGWYWWHWRGSCLDTESELPFLFNKQLLEGWWIIGFIHGHMHKAEEVSVAPK